VEWLWAVVPIRDFGETVEGEGSVISRLLV